MFFLFPHIFPPIQNVHHSKVPRSFQRWKGIPSSKTEIRYFFFCLWEKNKLEAGYKEGGRGEKSQVEIMLFASFFWGDDVKYMWARLQMERKKSEKNEITPNCISEDRDYFFCFCFCWQNWGFVTIFFVCMFFFFQRGRRKRPPRDLVSLTLSRWKTEQKQEQRRTRPKKIKKRRA